MTNSSAAKDSTPPDSPAQAQAVAKIVAAARTLFAERGPAAVPLREIAKAAGVNYGLIYQYIGTKDDLLRLVFRSASNEYADQFAKAGNARQAMDFLARSPNSEFARMLARTLLEGRDPESLLQRSPAMAELSRRIGAEMPDDPELSDADPRIVAAMLTTLSMGWNLYGGFVRTIIGLTEFSDQEVKDMMYEIALMGVDLAD